MGSKDIVLYRGAEIDRFFWMPDQVRNVSVLLPSHIFIPVIR